MARGHEVRIASETREFERGIRTGVIDPLDDANRAIERLGDEAKDSGRDAARALDKYGDEIKRAQRETEKLENSSKSSFRGAGNATTEFKDEAAQNFSEIASSFDGSMESVGEMAQSTLGGLASSGLPAIGIAAGAAALAVGGITEYLTTLGERSEEIKEGVIDDFLELGDALDKEAVDARVRDILGTKETMREAQLLSDLIGITVGQAALAMAGDFESAGVTIEEVMAGINNAAGDVNTEDLEGLKNTVNSTTEAMEAGRQAAEAQAEAQKRTAATTKTEQAKVREETQRTKDALLDMVNGDYQTKLRVEVEDNTTAAVNRIVNRINGRVATITVNGRTLT